MLQCGAEWFFSKNVHNDLSVAYCKTLNQISNAAVAKCESIITFTVSAADSDLWWYNVLSRDDVWYGKKLLFFFVKSISRNFREIDFTKKLFLLLIFIWWIRFFLVSDQTPHQRWKGKYRFLLDISWEALMYESNIDILA